MLVMFVLFSLPLRGQSGQTSPALVREFVYPDFNTLATDFSLLGPEMVLVSNGGGVFMAGTNIWYLAPSNERAIISAVPNVKEECLYYLSLQKKEQGMQTSLHRLKKTSSQSQVDDELTHFVSKQIVQASTIGNGKLFLVERGSHSQIWFFDGLQKKLIFKSEQPTTAFYPINESSSLVALGKEIVLLQSGQKPKTLITIKSPVVIDGICVNDNEQIYFSTYRGIWKISGNLLARKLDCQLVVPKIHGSLKFLSPYLFVHIPKASTVVRLTIEN